MRNTNALANKTNNLINEPALINSIAHIDQTFHYWHGASGKRYVHTIYALTQCPIMPKANYILVKQEKNGKKIALRIGQTIESASSLNLAHLRQKAAQLGANEIHIHVLSNTSKERHLTELDLRAGIFSHLSAENM